MIELLVVISYLAGGIECFPAIYRICKRKSSTDVSLMSAVLAVISAASWCLYVLATPQTLLTRAGAVISVAIVFVWSVVVFRYHKRLIE